jgi:hypothetical protein
MKNVAVVKENPQWAYVVLSNPSDLVKGIIDELDTETLFLLGNV